MTQPIRDHSYTLKELLERGNFANKPTLFFERTIVPSIFSVPSPSQSTPSKSVPGESVPRKSPRLYEACKPMNLGNTHHDDDCNPPTAAMAIV